MCVVCVPPAFVCASATGVACPLHPLMQGGPGGPSPPPVSSGDPPSTADNQGVSLRLWLIFPLVGVGWLSCPVWGSPVAGLGVDVDVDEEEEDTVEASAEQVGGVCSL